MNYLSHKLNEYGWFALKVSALIAALVIVVLKWRATPSEVIQMSLNVFTLEALPWGLLIVILASFNWILIIIQWQYSTKDLAPLNFVAAAKQCFIAFNWAFNTPSRIGEYGAKAAFYPSEQRPQIIALQACIHGTQLIATIIFGGVGVLINSAVFPGVNLDITPWSIGLCAAGFMSLFFLFLWVKQKQHLQVLFLKSLRALPRRKVAHIMGLSLLRYIIFSFMFLMIFRFLGAEISLLMGLSTIACIYLFQAIIPVFSMFDVVIRGSIALVLFTPYGLDSVLILSAIFLQWTLSALWPLALGSIWQMTTLNKRTWA